MILIVTGVNFSFTANPADHQEKFTRVQKDSSGQLAGNSWKTWWAIDIHSTVYTFYIILIISKEHKTKFTEDQLVVMTDLLVSQNYYA